MKRATEILAALVNDPGAGIEDAMLQVGMEQVILTVAEALGMEAAVIAAAIERHADLEADLLSDELHQFEVDHDLVGAFDEEDEVDPLDLPLDEFSLTGFAIADQVANDASISQLYGVMSL